MALRVPPAPQLPTVRQAAMPDVRVGQDTRGTHGEEVGQALTQVGTALGQYAAKALDEANASAVDGGFAEAQDWVTSSLTDDKAGLLHKQGLEAFGGADAFYESMAKKKAEVTEKLIGKQKDMFLEKWQSLELDARRRVETHLAGERRTHDAQTAQSTISASQRALVADAFVPDMRAARVQEQVDEVQKMAARSGWSAATSMEKANEVRAQAATIVLEQYAAKGREAEGLEYLKEVRDVLGPAAARYEAQFSAKQRAIAADVKASEVAQAARVEGYPMDYDKGDAEVEALPAGDLKDAVRPRWEFQKARAKEAHARKVEDVYNEAVSVYYRTGNINHPDIINLRTWLLDPKNDAVGKWDDFAGKVRDREAREREGTTRARGEQARLDEEYLQDFRVLSDEDRTAVNVVAKYPDASGKTINRMREEQRQAGERIRKGQSVDSPQFKLMIAAAAESVPALAQNKELATQFRNSMLLWLTNHPGQEKGQPPTVKEVNETMIERLKLHTGGTFGFEFYAFEKPAGADLGELVEVERQPYAPTRARLEEAARKAAAPAAAPPAPAAERPEHVPRADYDRLLGNYRRDHPGEPDPPPERVRRAYNAEAAELAKRRAKQ